MKVSIKNFQSIEEAQIEIEGFTVIVGRSNLGKSVVVRAIDGALSNKPGDSFVRLGAKYSEVRLECPEIDLLWKKGGGFNDYVIDGTPYESVGLGSPSPVAMAGFKAIETSRDSVSVQVASQFSPIFLLDPSKTTGSTAAEVVSDVGRLGELQEALQSAGKDRRGLANTLRVREKDLTEAEKGLQAYSGLSGLLEKREALLTLKRDIEKAQKRLEALRTFYREYQEALSEVERYRGADNLTVPEWSGDKTNKRLQTLRAFQGHVAEATASLKAYEGLDLITLPEWKADDDLKKIQALTTFEGHLTRAREDVSRMAQVPIADLPPEPNLSGNLLSLREHRDLYKDFELLTQEIEALAPEVQVLTRDLQESEASFQDLLEEAGICPLCERDVKHEH